MKKNIYYKWFFISSQRNSNIKICSKGDVSIGRISRESGKRIHDRVQLIHNDRRSL